MPRRAAGVDGCRGGWAAVSYPFCDPGQAVARFSPRFEDFLDLLDPGCILAVDIPIGLPERAVRGGRAADWAAREFLGARRAAVFPIPSRQAVYAYREGYAQVCRVARETSDPPRALSLQAYQILPRIQEVDQLLFRRPELARRIFEAHPEVSFALMHGGEPLPVPKKGKGRLLARGLECRRQILESQGFSAAFLEAPPPAGAALDDLYDACACAWSASRIIAKRAITLPAKPGAGASGRLAAVWA
ncbi:MAG TPA: DUF429 domain-containing protein [Methylocella sp.]|nr:DUF429 domain-containing protein [Methylocella sp.]